MPPLPQSTATIVLVPGAFHIDSSMDLLGAQLQRAGYNTHSASLVTVNGPSKNISDDIDYLQTQVLEPLIGQQGRDIVLYLHSYAGFPGSVAIEGYSKTARLANGTAGGILGLIYQSAFIPKQGDSLLQMIGGNYAPWQQLNVCARDSITSSSSKSKTNHVTGRYQTHYRSRSHSNFLCRRSSTTS